MVTSPQPSMPVAVPVFSGAVEAPHATFASAGQLIVGGVVSATFTGKSTVVVPPLTLSDTCSVKEPQWAAMICARQVATFVQFGDPTNDAPAVLFVIVQVASSDEAAGRRGVGVVRVAVDGRRAVDAPGRDQLGATDLVVLVAEARRVDVAEREVIRVAADRAGAGRVGERIGGEARDRRGVRRTRR